MPPLRPNRRSAILLASAVVSALPAVSLAQTSGTWIVDADGSWSMASNWSPAIPDGGGVATFINLPSFTVAPRNIFQDLPNVTLDRIVYETPFTYNLRLPVGNTTNTITLVGNAELRHNIPSTNAWGSTTNGQLFAIPLTGSAGMVKSGPGTVSVTVNNTYAGGTSINGGILRITTGNGALGDASGALNFNEGTLRIGTTALQSARAINLVGSGTFETTASGVATLSSVISGAGALNKNGSAVMGLTGASNYTGATNIWSGSLVLNGNGALQNTSSILANGTITMDNVATNVADRLNNAAGVTFTGSGLALTGNAAGSSETIGAATFSSGITTFTVTPDAASNSSITAASAQRVNGGAAFFRANSLGQAPAANVGNIYFTTPPAMLSGPGRGITNIPIIPWAYGADNSASISTNANASLVTYGANGVRPLNLATEYQTSLPTALPGDHVRITSAQSVTSPVTVNSLVISTGGSVSGGGTITLNTGVLLNAVAGTIIPNPINFAAHEGILHAPNSITLSGPISGTAGLTKTSGGAATFANATSTYTGVTTLGGGTVFFANNVGSGVPGPFGSDTSPIVLAAGDFTSTKLIFNGTGPATFDRGLINNSFNAYLNGALLPQFGVSGTQALTMNGPVQLNFPLVVTGSAGGQVIINGKISGPWFLTEGSNTVTTVLNGNNDYTGGTELNGGTWQIGSDTAFGTGVVKMVALSATPTLSAVGGPRVVPNDVLSLSLSTNYWTITGSQDITFTGKMLLADLGTANGTEVHTISNTGLTTYAGTLSIGGLTKAGAGTLVLSGNNDYNSITNVNAGVLRIASSNALGSPLIGATVATGATMEILNNSLSSEPVTINGDGIAAASGAGAIRSTSGTNSLGDITLATSSTIGVDAGKLTVGNIGFTTGTPNLTKVGGGELAANRYRVNNLNINAGTASVTPGRNSIAKLSTVAALNIAGGATPTATLDLGDNDLVATATPVATIVSQIVFARDGGVWDRPGISSIIARTESQKIHMLGVLSGAEYIAANSGTFDGRAVAPTDTLVRFTYYGDSDFNGKVNFDDYARIDNGFNNQLTGWLNGDFNLNGVVNFDDYALIDFAFNNQTGTITGPRAVPEPAICTTVGVASASLLRRRRRR